MKNSKKIILISIIAIILSVSITFLVGYKVFATSSEEIRSIADNDVFETIENSEDIETVEEIIDEGGNVEESISIEDIENLENVVVNDNLEDVELIEELGTSNEEENIEYAESVNVEKMVGGMAIQKKIIKRYQFTASNYKKIQLFPIDKYVFNSDSDFFCAQHGTPYGSSYRATTLAAGYHTTHTVTKHRVKSHYSNDPKGDIDTTANIYLDKEGKYVLRYNRTYQSYREYNETATATLFTNWVYNLQDLKFDCEYSDDTSKISNGGISFLLACYKQTDAQRKQTGYNNDPLQFAVWSWLGQSTPANPLKEAAKSYQQYHKASKNPKVDATPASNVGAKISGTTYTVGPFKMSAYVRAEDYIYDEKGTYSAVVQDGTITGSDGEDIYNLNINNSGVNLQDTIHKYDNTYDGTIIKAEAVVTNGSGSTKRIEFPVPEPNATFNIDISEAALEGYDELLDIVFTYQRIHASGNGTKYIGKQEAVYFTENYAGRGCTRYYCAGDNPHKHSGCGCLRTYCGRGGIHYYTVHSGCNHSKGVCHKVRRSYRCNSCVKICKGNHTDCHGHSAGNPIRGGKSTSHTYAYCTHGHKECKKLTWNRPPTHWGDYAQDGLAASGALSTEKIEYSIRVSVPLKTKMSVYKYITKAEHVGESKVIYSSTSRRNMTMDQKSNNPIKVEKGDKITYKIEIVNDSRFPTRVKVKDILPEPCSDEEIPDVIRYSEWITVRANSKNTYTITLRTNADSGKYTNTLEFITTNKTNPTMQCTYWYNNATHGAHMNGAIVNTATREKDSDTYQIKEFNVSIEKYIYDVNHNKENISITNIDTSMSATNTRQRRYITEEQKKSNPVYAEYGDTVTYKIVVHNTTENKNSKFDVGRGSEPYWNPDKVYVDIQDTLPKKYSNLDVKITNSAIASYGYSSHTISMPAKSSENGGILTIYDLMVPAGQTRTITITLTVDEYTKGTVETNTAKFINNIKNINRGIKKVSRVEDKYCVIKNNSTNITSADYYKLNNYNVSLDKYLYKYDESVLNLNNSNNFTKESKITNSNGELLNSRDSKITRKQSLSDGNVYDTVKVADTSNETYKKEHPVNVEQTEKLVYAIKAKNEATAKYKSIYTGRKPATQVRTTVVTDYLQQGLTLNKVTATMYNSSGQKVKDVNVVKTEKGTTTFNGNTYNKYEYVIDNSTILDPGYYIIYYVEVTVTESNMYLYSLENKAELSILTNINNTDKSKYIVKDNSHNENIARQQISSEFVRMKDLVISGQVWLDINRDGYMNDTARSELEKINNNINSDAMKKDIEVRLYRIGAPNNPIRTTKTDENGLYTFGRGNDSNEWYDTYNHTVAYNNTINYQRIDKASDKDQNGNYKNNSNYYEYYVEFAYDGVVYKSTEVYSGTNHLEEGKGTCYKEYFIDSNATELIEDREKFNKNYEYISYNVAYDINNVNEANLKFQKENHTSELIEDSSREITAKSFIKPEEQKIRYLWLYPFGGKDKNTIPETDYLKYINLGLELREDVDLELTKDVYKVKTTINGEEMEYDYNLGETPDYLNDYIVKKPYGLEIYESDYKYRVDQFFSDAVRAYKGVNGADELNVEVTFKINLKNKATTDDDLVENAIDTKLDVKVNEILDLYDENFMELQFDENGNLKTGTIPETETNEKAITNSKIYNKINVKQKENEFLVDVNLDIGEAWYYDESGNRKDLELSNISKYSKKSNDFKEDGYNTVYIRGMENVIIKEGESLDIYVKYIVDKDALETTIQNESFETEVDKNVFTKSSNDNLISEKITSVQILSNTQAIIERSLKLSDIKDNSANPYKEANGRGTENIAQINAYSVWYTDGKPASLVDKDSNAGNIGVQNLTSGKSAKTKDYKEDTEASADNIEFYEDTTYKTGIEIAAEGSENTKKQVNEKSRYGQIFGDINTQVLRGIKGKVWDDSRSEYISENNADTDKDKQYVGNGIYTDESNRNRDKKHLEAKYNESLVEFYKLNNASVSEENDLLVRNAKAEFIEIVQVPIIENGSVKEVRYYEEILMGVTWEQVQHIRTNDNGEYLLTGLKPGNYIVRFTYGDTVEANKENYDANIQAQQDMLIFNGQDYKSTTYNSALSDTEKDIDAIIKGLEAEDVSDARDDEIRRLQVNSYSEIMTNDIAEILKGIANKSETLTPNSDENTVQELETLTDNTYMQAETREFLVKTEKLTASQTALYSSDNEEESKDIFYKELENMKNSIIDSRNFLIENVDFGIEYRPESEISLIKEISEIKLITEDTELLVDLHFYTDSDGKNRKHYIDSKKSIGFDLVQFITNNYTTKALLNNLTSEEEVQGLIYIQVDQEILQGATVEITYSFDAQNNSEVDRISTNLDEIRYKANQATVDLREKVKTIYGIDIVDENRYTASGTASKVIDAETYRNDSNQAGVKYRIKPKLMTTIEKNGDDGYFGKYTGYTYHTGKIAKDIDTVSSLKFDKILDYVDTGLKYENDPTQKDLTNKFWVRVESTELVDHVYTLRPFRVNGIDNSEAILKDTEDMRYESLVVSVDDRIVDKGDPQEKILNQTNVKNNELSRFLLPKVLITGYVSENDESSINVTEEEKRTYSGTISLDVSKILAAGTDGEDMTYENMAEIIQFTTLNGRRTNFATTIGNANVHTTKDKVKNANSGSTEFMTASLEPDTSATETITLMPPTGLMKSRRAIVDIMDTAKAGVEVMSMTGLVVAIVAVIVIIVLFIIRKYKKRRIK